MQQQKESKCFCIWKLEARQTGLRTYGCKLCEASESEKGLLQKANLGVKMMLEDAFGETGKSGCCAWTSKNAKQAACKSVMARLITRGAAAASVREKGRFEEKR